MYKEDYTIQDYLQYKKMLDDCLAKGEKVFFKNESLVHAAMVMNAIIRSGIQNGKAGELDMFCGEFSLFRDGVRKKLDQIRSQVVGDGKDEKIVAEWESIDPYHTLRSTLDEFFEKRGRLNLIVTRSLEGIKDEDVWASIDTPIREGQMKVMRLRQMPLDHFVVCGDSFRKENSDKEKTAYCGFFNPDMAKSFRQVFYDIRKMAQPYPKN